MAQRTKKQHLVPRFYLSKFGDADDLVWTYAAKTKPRGRKSEATAVETNFYSPIGEDGERYDEVEKLLGLIESGAAPLWGAVTHGKVLAGDDRDMLALFLAAQYLRSPSVVYAGAEMMAGIVHHTTQVLAANKKAHERSVDDYEVGTGVTISPDEREKMREFLSNPDNFTLSVLRSAGLPMLGSMGHLADIFSTMKWVVGRSRDQHLITSDSPVTRISDPATHSPIYGDGAFANKTVRVQFPLSPDRMLEMTWQGEERERVAEIPKFMAREMNGRRAAQAHRFVYANQYDLGIAKLCDKWLDGERPPKISTGRKMPKIEIKRKL